LAFEWAKFLNLLDWLKRPKYVFAIGVTCLLIISLPTGVQRGLGYEGFISPYRGWIALVGIASCGYAFVLWIVDCIAWFWGRLKRWLFIKRGPIILQGLCRDEKAYLAKYILHDVSSLQFGCDEGIINALAEKGIVYRASNVSWKTPPEFSFNLQPWVVEVLRMDENLKRDIVQYYVEEHKGRGMFRRNNF
jgi:hypothetical protein